MLRPMRVLWIATKAPVPPVDGGRLVQKLTLEALAERGVEVTLVAPVYPGEDLSALDRKLSRFCRPHLVRVTGRGAWRALSSAHPGGLPLALARHAHPEVRRLVAALVAGGAGDGHDYDVVHAEQLHAVPQAEVAVEAGLPLVLRTQNVESDLWRAAAGLLTGSALAPRGLAARVEAWRLARWEGEAVSRADRVVALTPPDARRLGSLAGRGTTVVVVPAPFPGELPAGARRLDGEPSVVVLGSGGWAPNRDAAAFMVREVWPEVRRRVTGAVLHLFGDEAPAGSAVDGEGIRRHPSPDDSTEAFAVGSVLAVPLRVASGVRMKILEAWARGLPVVATPQAAAGLDAVHGRELLVAADADGFATAVARLAAEPDLAPALVAAGRASLAERHAPAEVACRLEAVYAATLASGDAFAGRETGGGAG